MEFSTLKGFAGATALAIALAAASQAPAATINFATGGDGTTAGGTVAGGPLTYTLSASADGPLNWSASVTQGSQGLGVNSFPDATSDLVDNNPGGESLTVTFSWAVKLLDISLGYLDWNDDVWITTSGTAETKYGPGLSNPISIGENFVTWFSIRAKNLGGFFGNGDEYSLRSANIASVPVPAAGFLLIGALGGLAALRRRKNLTAA